MSALSYSVPWARARLRVARPELLGVLSVAGLLNLWGLSINGWANTYYAAAVKSMSTSWHDFLFAAMDKTGLMTIDKPPLSLWIQALSARVFGYHPLSLLVPQALMGVAAAGLMYDLTRRRFGRVAGFVAGIALATTPVIVGVSRHNNPDELLVLCTVAALWCLLRALDTGRTRWLVWCGVAIGLGFETKMGVALMVVPAFAAAWLWMRPNLRALRQLLWGGLAMAVVAGAWPLLVTLTPASDRPWISGTSDNSVWSLIFGYNGLGRISGQTGGPGGGGGTLFGGATGPFRLLQSGLGDQAGWLLGAALAAALVLVVFTRLRRGDPRTGHVIASGGSLAVIGVVFSFASGIFHPYYVSMIAPWAATLAGAGVGEMLPRPLGVARSLRTARIVAPAVIAGGVVTELVVLGGIGGQLSWAKPLLIVVGGGAALALAFELAPRLRTWLVAAALVTLLAAPSVWAAETLGHATNGTFPAGGPSTTTMGGFGGGPGGGARGAGGGFGFGGPPGAALGGPPGGAAQGGPGFVRAAGGGGMFGGNSTTLKAASTYAREHGGGTVAVESQSSAAAAILDSGANIAGIGGFSGRESTVSASWIRAEVKAGRLRWLLDDGSGSARLPGDTRSGSASAISAIERAARKVTFTSNRTTVTMYDLKGLA